MTLVVDASAVVAFLIDDGPVGRWAESQFERQTLVAPHLMPVEAASILRRSVLASKISAEIAALAHSDLSQLRIGLFPYRPLGDRVWQLRNNLTCYDAWYVAVAELLDVPIVTLDRRLAGAPGVRCRFELPE